MPSFLRLTVTMVLNPSHNAPIVARRRSAGSAGRRRRCAVRNSDIADTVTPYSPARVRSSAPAAGHVCAERTVKAYGRGEEPEIAAARNPRRPVAVLMFVMMVAAST